MGDRARYLVVADGEELRVGLAPEFEGYDRIRRYRHLVKGNAFLIVGLGIEAEFGVWPNCCFTDHW